MSAPLSPILDHYGLLDESLEAFRDVIAGDWMAYRGHVYRVFNFARALADGTADRDDKLALAAVFHDIGLWSDRTVDYLPPSTRRLRTRLEEAGRQGWADELSRMVELHHKLTPCRNEPLVEAFRRADLIDVSLGLVRCGLSRAYVREIQATFANAGFHFCLAQRLGGWAVRHPFRPLPMLRL